MKLLNFFLLAISIVPIICSAAVFHTIDTTFPISCTFSAQFHNRIIVEDGYVNNIVTSNEHLYSINLEEFSGQAFIYALDLNPQDALFSIITNTGKVQDIQVSFTDKPTEVVILKEPKVEIALEDDNCPEKAAEDDLLEKIKIVCAGQVPPNYTFCSVATKEWKPKKGITLKLHAKLDGAIDNLYIYRVYNCSRQTLTIQEQELQCNNSQWIYLQAHKLKQKESALCIIAMAKNE